MSAKCLKVHVKHQAYVKSGTSKLAIGILFLALVLALPWPALASARSTSNAAATCSIKAKFHSGRERRGFCKRRLLGAAADDRDRAREPAAAKEANLNPRAAWKQRRSLHDCMAAQKDVKPFTTQDFKDGKPARLRPELQLSTTKSMAFGVTAVAPVSVTRISSLEGLCISWGGPLSVAVYVGLLESGPLPATEVPKLENPDEDDEEYDEGDILGTKNPLKTAVQTVKKAFDKIEKQKGGCQLTITLFSELLASKDEELLFPLNALRNAALLVVQTPLVFYADADMLLSNSLTAALSEPASLQQLLRVAEQSVFIVVPAFRAANLKTAYKSIQSKKAALDALHRSNISRYTEHFVAGHAPTNYARWAAIKSSRPPLYETKYQHLFEPWGIVSRRLAPMWDVKYRGYGKDKAAWTSHLHRAGFRFVVSVEGFMVHRPHKPSLASGAHDASVNFLRASKNNNTKGTKSAGTVPSQLLFGTNNKHFETDKMAHDQHTYKTVVGNTGSCRAVLPHWKIFGPTGTLPVV